jgi:hypothetical protein
LRGAVESAAAAAIGSNAAKMSGRRRDFLGMVTSVVGLTTR